MNFKMRCHTRTVLVWFSISIFFSWGRHPLQLCQKVLQISLTTCVKLQLTKLSHSKVKIGGWGSNGTGTRPCITNLSRSATGIVILEVNLFNILVQTVSNSYRQQETIKQKHHLCTVEPSTPQFGKLIAFEIEFPQNNTNKFENWLPCCFSKLLCPVELKVKIFGILKPFRLRQEKIKET